MSINCASSGKPGPRYCWILAWPLFTAVVAAIFILNGPVFSVDAALVQAAEFPESGRDIFMQVFNVLENLILPIILIAELITAGSKVYKLWQMPKNETPPTLAGKMG
ncbi:MAG: hypothetical protein HC804_12355 [Anaerolineae bacterium]|nr:hypothetical protein [Anaerolineae bacterium]